MLIAVFGYQLWAMDQHQTTIFAHILHIEKYLKIDVKYTTEEVDEMLAEIRRQNHEPEPTPTPPSPPRGGSK
jgi:hypothetical protein